MKNSNYLIYLKKLTIVVFEKLELELFDWLYYLKDSNLNYLIKFATWNTQTRNFCQTRRCLLITQTKLQIIQTDVENHKKMFYVLLLDESSKSWTKNFFFKSWQFFLAKNYERGERKWIRLRQETVSLALTWMKIER